MSLEVTIRGLSEDVYASLSAKAAMQEKSLEDYLHGELQRIAQTLSAKEWLEEVRKIREREPSHVSSEVIVRMLREDRK